MRSRQYSKSTTILSHRRPHGVYCMRWYRDMIDATGNISENGTICNWTTQHQHPSETFTHMQSQKASWFDVIASKTLNTQENISWQKDVIFNCVVAAACNLVAVYDDSAKQSVPTKIKCAKNVPYHCSASQLSLVSMCHKCVMHALSLSQREKWASNQGMQGSNLLHAYRISRLWSILPAMAMARKTVGSSDNAIASRVVVTHHKRRTSAIAALANQSVRYPVSYAR